MPKKVFDTAKKQEKCLLVGVLSKSHERLPEKEFLDELESLAVTAGVKTLKRFTQKLEYPNPKTFIGKGKLEEIAEYAKIHEPDMVIFDEELSPSQIRNLEAELKDIKIIDRSSLILDIFANNAQTAQAKLQVELAQCRYLLPRLTRMWTHLQKQKGGVGMKGPGETEIETDRRAIRNKITRLTEKLNQIEKQGETQRKNRTGLKRFALVGYTNAGKSTLMNLLTKENLIAEDRLFATLDSTIRKVSLPLLENQNIPQTFLISDTVGFIRKLPTLLIESFKSTLAEAREADILIHVADLSHHELNEQLEVVHETLAEIGISNKPTILVLNKTDKFVAEYEEKRDPFYEPEVSLANIKKYWESKHNGQVVLISASDGSNLNGLTDIMRIFL